MCLEEYVGCPSCGTAADSGEVHAVYLQCEYINVPLNSDGTENRNDDPVFGDIESEDRGYSCGCGWQGPDLNDALVRDECECEECNPPSFMDGGDEPDRDAIITVQMASLPPAGPELPYELVRMAQDRALWYIVVPRWRAYELEAEFPQISAEYTPDRVLSDEARVLTYPTFDDREVTSA